MRFTGQTRAATLRRSAATVLRRATGTLVMMQHSETEALVAAAQRGDRLALAKLLARCHPDLRARAAARMDPALKVRKDPEDILQEVYLDIARRLGRFEYRGPDSFLNWATAILSQRIIDAQRTAHRLVRDVAREVPADGAAQSCWNLLDQVYADSGTPSRVLRRQEALGALLTCVSDLSETQRQVIEMRFLDGLPVAQVAARLQKTEAAIVALTRRALKELRRLLDQRGEFTHGG